MSKEAALRAMREARYAERSAQATRPTRAITRPTPRTAESEPTKPVPSSADGLCGHRSINGRTCTREHGHDAKSHRYP